MVKFSKQFEGQLIPEWKEAFVDYWRLKKDVKRIHLLSNGHNDLCNKHQNVHNSLSITLSSSLRNLPFCGPHHLKRRVIQVHRKIAGSPSKADDIYETELMDQFNESEAVGEFFGRLDFQLNKVNQFYRSKEKEFVERGNSLKKQMEILIELKTALRNHHLSRTASSRNDDDDDDLISATISCDEQSIKIRARQEQEQGQYSNSADDCSTGKNETQFTDSSRSLIDHLGKSMKREEDEEEEEEEEEGTKLKKSLSAPAVNLNAKGLRIHIPLTNPTHIFSAITYLLWDDLVIQSSKKCVPEGNKLHLNSTKLRRAEKMIRGAFIDLYKGLCYLKTYRNLNMLAFVKILKKFDKVTNKEVLPIYLRVVESSYFNSSDKVVKLADEVEEIFIKHFAQHDKRKAMKYLNPTQRKDSHAVTFFIGFFTGCFLALLAGYIIMARYAGMYGPQSDTVYMESAYPLLSIFSLLFLHFFLYGCNIIMWKKTRINYCFIFELNPKMALKHRDVFLICATSMTAVVGVLFVHLLLMAKAYTCSQVQAIPGLLSLVFLLLLVCPFNIIYKSSRYRFLCIIRTIFLSPLYEVIMLDFFMADQLCSQVPMLRNLEMVVCYYVTGSYKTQDYGYCNRNKNYRDLGYAVSFLPYYWRAMQCARRWFDEGQKSHLINLGKYVSAMLAAGAKVAYEKDKTVGRLFLFVAMSSTATLYQLYWDFVKDWGLLQFTSKNPWLRDELMLRGKFIYYASMGVNLILRLAWLQTVLHYQFSGVDGRLTGLFLAALEVVRRGQWNFYRLENEHLNNAGKFRAVKTVPLPFEVDEQA